MIVILGFVLIILALIAVRAFADFDSDITEFGLFSVGFLLVIVLLGLVATQTDGTPTKTYATLSNKLAAIQSGIEFSVYEKAILVRDIIEFNANLYRWQKKLDNPFSNWFYPSYLRDMKPIPLP